MPIRLFLVRHTKVNVPRGICYGQSDVPLAETFEQEANALKAHLTARCPSPDMIFSSPLSRCTRLAEYCGYPQAQQDQRLLELNFGDWEMKPFDEIEDPRLELWYDDWINVSPTGGESYLMQCQRVAHFLDDLRIAMADGSEALIFAHAGILRASLVYTGEYSHKSSFDYNPSYGEVLSITLL